MAAPVGQESRWISFLLPSYNGEWEAIRAGAVVVEPVVAADLEVAFAIGDEVPDQDFSIVDRTIYAVMRRLGVHRAATLDEHFAIYRFGRNRARAFEIVR